MKSEKLIRTIARALLLVIAAFWFVFALLSGAQELGGGIKGIVMNSPNALPWLVLLGLVYVAWRWELVGGSIIAAMGLATIVLFDAYEHLVPLFAISVPLVLLGGALMYCGWKARRTGTATKP